MEGTFYNCMGLTGDIPNWNLSNVKNMGKTFYNCMGLTGDIPN